MARQKSTELTGRKIWNCALSEPKPRDLVSYLGGPSRVAEALSRRVLTIAMIRRLHQGLGIPADILIQPYPLFKASAWQPAASPAAPSPDSRILK